MGLAGERRDLRRHRGRKDKSSLAGIGGSEAKFLISKEKISYSGEGQREGTTEGFVQRVTWSLASPHQEG